MGNESINRRRWLGATTAGAIGFSLGKTGLAQQSPGILPKPAPAVGPLRDIDEAELEKELREAGFEELNRLRSNHYLALGDASESFLRSTLTDCEQLLIAYERHFRDHGFDVKKPERPLMVAVFADDRSFAKYHKLTQPMREGDEAVGAYDRTTNLLSVFDWRNVPRVMRAGHRNTQALSHWGTHQLTCNTGLLNRGGDIPAGIYEGLGTYGEPRKVMGPSDLGRMNVQRADDLAKLRRALPWIDARQLLTNDTVFRVAPRARAQLAYAESWALVHLLMNNEDRLPGFRDYLAVLKTRANADHRLEDIREHLGGVKKLDHDLKVHMLRLVHSL